MPRRSAAAALQTRRSIVDTGVQLASVHGLSRVSAGDIAGRLGLSRAGVIGPFGTMEELQLAVLDAGAGIFRREVWAPVAELRAGRIRLQATMEAWISYLERMVLPGGCLLTTASTEFDALDGQVHDRVAKLVSRWQKVLVADAQVAVRAGELDGDPHQIAFELYGLALSLNQSVILLKDPNAAERARSSAARILG